MLFFISYKFDVIFRQLVKRIKVFKKKKLKIENLKKNQTFTYFSIHKLTLNESINYF
jgi:hypothetical protein